MIYQANEVSMKNNLPVVGDTVIFKNGLRYEVKASAMGWFLVNSSGKVNLEIGKQHSQLEFVKQIIEEDKRR
jgi:hypothetical protein